MIKEKFLEFLNWLKDHFLFLLEVVVRLSVGFRKEKKITKHYTDSKDESGKGDKQ